MGKVEAYQCDLCAQIIRSGWIVEQALRRIPTETRSAGIREGTYCEGCLARAIDGEVRRRWEESQPQRGGPGDR